jgi:thiol:disulfide interchange protein DsbC
MIRTLLAAALAGFAFTAQADDDARIRAAITSLVPNASIDSIAEAKLPGFYEVVLSGQILYVSADGKYLLQGMLFDIESRTDLTESSRSQLRKVALQDLKPGMTIDYLPKSPKHLVTVFTDIDCGYCRRMHAQMGEYNALGIGIQYLFFPRAGAGSEAWQQAVSVWCSDDRAQALTDAKAGKPIDRKECSNPIASDYALGSRIGVSGTPMVIAADGTQLGGYLPPDQMLQRLDQLAQKPGG